MCSSDLIFGQPKEKMDLKNALAIVQDVRGVKEMIDAKMADRGHERRNVKLGTGGIREIEFFVQTVQVIAGKRVTGLLDRSTLGALDRFVRYKLISKQERDDLTAAYVFLRDVEHKLQMVQDFQTHALPDSAEELERCAIRGGYDTDDRTKGVAQFNADHKRHTSLVNRFFRSFYYDANAAPVLKATMRLLSASK